MNQPTEHTPSNDWVYVLKDSADPDVIRYDQFVLQLAKAQTRKEMIFHAILGICEEAGELASGIKKELVYNKPTDRKNIVEELGDLRFYMRFLQNMYDITDQEVLQGNADKLSVRYKDLRYTDNAAQKRVDKFEDNLPDDYEV